MLTQLEWESIINYTCTKHLATNWIYDSWFNQQSNKFEQWKITARKWLEGIVYRYENKELIRSRILEEIKF